METDIKKEQALLNFYQKFVTLSQKDLSSGEHFFEQALINMIFNHEFKRKSLCSVEAYEKLLLWNLSYNNMIYEKSYEDYLEILGPFSIINFNNYYTYLLSNDLFLNQELFMICKLADELKNKNGMPISLLSLKNQNFITTYYTILKLEEIFRKGWIIRNVEKEYVESDAIHTMQMLALASAYFNIYNDLNLDKRKVFEMILIHEIGEIKAGDIPEIDPRHDTKHDIEYRAVKEIFSNLSSGNDFILLWSEFEERKTQEAKFVYDLDKLDPILKAKYLDSVLNRNDLFEEFYLYEEQRKTFEESKFQKLFQFLKTEHSKNKIITLNNTLN